MQSSVAKWPKSKSHVAVVRNSRTAVVKISNIKDYMAWWGTNKLTHISVGLIYIYQTKNEALKAGTIAYNEYMQTGHQAYQNIIKNHVKPRIGFYLLSQN